MSNSRSTEVVPSQLESGPHANGKPSDANATEWYGPNDPANPQNWPSWERWAHVIVVAVLALVTNMGPTMCAPGINDVNHDLEITSPHLSTLAVTIYMLGLAVGPMLIAPLSEVYGRLIVYHSASIAFFAFIIGNALSRDIGQFMVFRFLSGCAGGTPMALGGGTIADVTTLEKRGVAMGLFSLGPLTGPVLGPVIGGFIVDHLGWRWAFWILAILGGVSSAAAVVVMRETQPRVLLQKKAARLGDSTASSSSGTHYQDVRSLHPHRLLIRALVRPTVVLIRSPIVLVISLYMALVFGVMYLLFTTFTELFENQYGFSTSVSGLAYLGLGVALVAAMTTFTALDGRIRKSRMQSNKDQQPRPEDRLILMIYFSPMVGFGLFVYGWTAHYTIHWIVPIIGTIFIGFGAFFVMMPAQLYLVDLFGSDAAASVLGASNLLRFLSSTFLPLAGSSMYRTLGYGWGNTLLGFLALSFVPAPVLFCRYGDWLRARSSLKP